MDFSLELGYDEMFEQLKPSKKEKTDQVSLSEEADQTHGTENTKKEISGVEKPTHKENKNPNFPTDQLKKLLSEMIISLRSELKKLPYGSVLRRQGEALVGEIEEAITKMETVISEKANDAIIAKITQYNNTLISQCNNSGIKPKTLPRTILSDISWGFAMAGIFLVTIGMVGEQLTKNAGTNHAYLVFSALLSQKIIRIGCDVLRYAGCENKASFFEKRHDKQIMAITQVTEPVLKKIAVLKPLTFPEPLSATLDTQSLSK